MANQLSNSLASVSPTRGVWLRLSRPVPLIALLALVVNDHALKAAFPGVATGKISDVAGLIVFPLFLAGIVGLVHAATGRKTPAAVRLVTGTVILTGVAFAAVKCLPPATDLWALGLAVAQWPFHALASSLSGLPTPSLRPVLTVTDPTDLVALPALLVAWLEGTGRSLRFGAPRKGNAPNVSRTARHRRGAGSLALVGFILAGAATIATSPARGEVSGRSLPVEFAFTAEEPVGTQEFQVAIDASDVSGSVDVMLQVSYAGPGVRSFLSDGTIVRTPDERAHAGAVLAWGCGQRRCERRVTLFVERVDPAAMMRPITLDLKVTPQTANEVVPLERITFEPIGVPSVRAAPVIVREEISGETTVSPDVPIVEQRVLVHRDAGHVADAGLLLIRGFVGFDPTADERDYDVAVIEPRGNEHYHAHAGAGGPNDILESVGMCPTTEPCDVEYILRFRSDVTSSGPVTIPWRLGMEMVDFAADALPSGRRIVIDPPIHGPAVGATAIQRSASGRYDMTSTGEPAKLPYVVTIDQAVGHAIGDQPRNLLVTHVLTLRGVESDGPHTRDGRSIATRIGEPSYVTGAFDADGAPHTFYRYDVVTCDDRCVLEYDFDARDEHDELKLPVALSWNLEVRVAAWGEPDLDPGDGLNLEILPLQQR